MRSALRELIRDARDRPGTYQMLTAEGEVLYVGKSKRVRTRLLSHLRAKRTDKAHRILQGTTRIEWEYDPSEFGALLRELELIKRLRPRYNVQHKRDPKYSFLKLSGGLAPKLFVVASVSDDSATYYGPFRGGRRVAEAVRELNDVLGLRDCAAATPMHFADQPEIFAFDRTPRCHRLEMRRCAGPCAGGCTGEDYLRRVALARAFLNGDADEPLRWLNERMASAAEGWKFEYAASLRDRIHRLEALRDEFGQLRETLDSLSFLYRVEGWGGEAWVYLIRRGTVRGAVPAPRTAAEFAALARLTDEHFSPPEPGGTLIARHQVEEILLIARWFRMNPAERERTSLAQPLLPRR